MVRRHCAYHPKAVGVYSRLGRRPANEGVTNRNKNIAMLYASFRVLNSLLPQHAADWREMLTSVGLDPDDNQMNTSTPIGIGNQAGNAIVAVREHDGMNQLGDEGGRKYNLRPYADYLGYEPVNTAYDLRNPSRWQPNIVTRGNGTFQVQQFVTPQLRKTLPYSYRNPNQFHAPVPTDSNHHNREAYRRQADEVLAASAALTDEQKMISELFDNKLRSLGFSILFASQANGLTLDEFVQLDFLTNMAAFDSGPVAKSDLVWSLLDNNGAALKAGLYDWTLTVKEPGEASPRVKRGRLNLENTNEPNSASQLPPQTVSGGGTVGAIPKWTTTTELDDSVITEDNGNVAIGSTPSGIIKLKVFLKPPDRDAHQTIEAILTESFYDDPVNNALDGQTTGSAVAGFATNTVGITSGVTGVSYSKHGTGVTGAAVSDTGNTIGVKGASKSPDGIGVQGAADSTTGENIGVRGESKSASGVGVYGIASETTGENIGVKGESASPIGYAGYFVGNVNVTGNLTKGGGAFKIDHPLDPENKTLSHSFVESPDMMNIYNGIVTLGKDGSAEVTLPDWFEALNREFRYQLTCIGGFAPVYVAKKVNGNRFEIAGGKPGMEVSWQLTGVRKDAYADAHRIQVEEMKPVAERGSYLHPEAFGKTPGKSVQRANEKAEER